MMENPTSSSLMDVDEMPTAVPAIAEAAEGNTNRRTEEDEWYRYGPDMNQKKRFLFCEHCSYKTLERPGLIGHLKMVHRFVTTAITPSPDVSQSQRADALISINAPPSTTESGGKIEGTVKNDDCCSLCRFETKNKKSLRHHMFLHSKKSAFQCRLCSYSVGDNGNLSRHMKNHHLGKERNPKQPNVNPVALPSTNHSGNDSLRKKKKAGLLFCSHQCEFSTRSKKDLLNHHQCHKKRSPLKCPLCSFSTNSPSKLGHHLQHHHSKRKQEKHGPFNSLSADQVNPSTSTAFTSITHQRGMKRKREEPALYSCLECDYQGPSLWHLRRHTVRHQVKSNNQCTRCSYSVGNPFHLTQHMKHNHPGQKRARATETIARKEMKGRSSSVVSDHLNMVPHFKHNHLNGESSSDQVVVGAASVAVAHLGAVDQRQKNRVPRHRALKKCSECNYSTVSRSCMKFHDTSHKRNRKFKCGVCTYSAHLERYVELHSKQCHFSGKSVSSQINSNLAPSSKEIAGRETDCTLLEAMRSGNHNNNDSSIHFKGSTQRNPTEPPDIFSSIFQAEKSAEEEEFWTKVGSRDENLQLAIDLLQKLRIEMDSKSEQEGKIQEVRNRIEVMKRKVRVAEKRLKEIASQKEELEKSMKETTNRKMNAEFALRSQQCKALERSLTESHLQLITEKERSNETAVAEEKIHLLKVEVSSIANQLRMLQGEQETLAENFEEAEGSLIGASQVLQALELELEGLMVSSKISAPDDSQDQLNELAFSTQVKIRNHFQDKSRLLKFGLVSIRNRSRLKKESLIEMLKSLSF